MIEVHGDLLTLLGPLDGCTACFGVIVARSSIVAVCVHEQGDELCSVVMVIADAVHKVLMWGYTTTEGRLEASVILLVDSGSFSFGVLCSVLLTRFVSLLGSAESISHKRSRRAVRALFQTFRTVVLSFTSCHNKFPHV